MLYFVRGIEAWQCVSAARAYRADLVRFLIGSEHLGNALSAPANPRQASCCNEPRFRAPRRIAHCARMSFRSPKRGADQLMQGFWRRGIDGPCFFFEVPLNKINKSWYFYRSPKLAGKLVRKISKEFQANRSQPKPLPAFLATHACKDWRSLAWSKFFPINTI